jgi:hypothetical protein
MLLLVINTVGFCTNALKIYSKSIYYFLFIFNSNERPNRLHTTPHGVIRPWVSPLVTFNPIATSFATVANIHCLYVIYSRAGTCIWKAQRKYT